MDYIKTLRQEAVQLFWICQNTCKFVVSLILSIFFWQLEHIYVKQSPLEFWWDHDINLDTSANTKKKLIQRDTKMDWEQITKPEVGEENVSERERACE